MRPPGVVPRRWRGLVLAAVALLGAACTSTFGGRRDPEPPRTVGRARDVRVALATAEPTAAIAASGSWTLLDAGGREVARGSSRDRFTVERRGRELRVVGGRAPTAWREGTLTLRADDRSGAMVSWGGKRYRGELLFGATDDGVLVVNRVPLDAYLRGVVPLEIGNRPATERAAVEAQAIAARSYTVARLGDTDARPYDLLATVADQVYGGVDAERAVSDAAIEATAGLVLTYEGRPVSAPYSSTCGGSTADPTELWRSGGAPYLKRVSDRIPGTDRHYCDAAPRFTWTRTYDAATLAAVVDRYLRAYSSAPAGAHGGVRSVSIEGRTASGRVEAITIATPRGSYRVRGNDVRYVLRSSGGELLNSTYFSLAPKVDRNGRLTELTLRGNGYGHGVGMCQWGAIGRARAGQSARVILQTYYPGTSIGRVD